MDREELYNTLTGAYGPLFSTIEMWACIAALGIKPHHTDDGWEFYYLDDCVDVDGFGDTIYEAACNFYKAICITEISNKI